MHFPGVFSKRKSRSVRSFIQKSKLIAQSQDTILVIVQQTSDDRLAREILLIVELLIVEGSVDFPTAEEASVERLHTPLHLKAESE
jgi:hypothetical protein